MIVNFPIVGKKVEDWAKRLNIVLDQAFRQINPPQPGVISLWKATVNLPPGLLPCDGAEYQKAVSPALYKLLGESSAGKFQTPSPSSPPAGFIWVVKT